MKEPVRGIEHHDSTSTTLKCNPSPTWKKHVWAMGSWLSPPDFLVSLKGRSQVPLGRRDLQHVHHNTKHETYYPPQQT